jgi:hypothetical protein
MLVFVVFFIWIFFPSVLRFHFHLFKGH